MKAKLHEVFVAPTQMTRDAMIKKLSAVIELASDDAIGAIVKDFLAKTKPYDDPNGIGFEITFKMIDGRGVTFNMVVGTMLNNPTCSLTYDVAIVELNGTVKKISASFLDRPLY